MKSETAFPVNHGGKDDRGMTLQDYFAGQALVGMLAGGLARSLTTENLAAQCYVLADAMLAERAK